MSVKPRILVLSDWYSPAYKAGGPIRSIASMIALCQGEIAFHVLCRNTDWMESHAMNVPADKWLEKEHHRVKYLSGAHLINVLREIMGDRDRTVYFNGIYSPLYNALPLLFCLLINRKRVIVSPRGMLNPNAISLKSAKKRALLKAFKYFGIERKVVFHTASAKETRHLLEQFPDVLPQAIMEVANVPAVPNEDPGELRHRDRYLSVGRISRVKNTHVLIEAFLDSGLEGGHLDVVGTTDDRDYYSECESLASRHSGIQLIGGRDPGSLQKLYMESGFFCLATSGENFGHAIVEALASGTPVIISDQTPWSDLQAAGAGWVVPLDQRDQWAKVFRETARLDERAYSAMSAAAKKYVRSKFNIDELRQQYKALFE